MKNYFSSFQRSFIVLLFISYLASGSPVHAQENVKIRRGEFKTEQEEGFKEAWKAVRKGNKLYKEGQGTYKQAGEYFATAYDFNPDNPELNYKIGVCYLYTDRKFDAVNYLKKAFEVKPEVSEDIHFLLGRAHHLVLEFDEAIQHYEDYKTTLHPRRDADRILETNLYINQCRNGRQLVEDPLRVIITNLGDSVNSAHDDYNAIVTHDDSLMFFTSRREHSEKAKRNPYDNKFYEDIYRSRKRDGKWTGAENIGKPINSRRHNEAAVGISEDRDELYIYRGNKNMGDIYYSSYKKGKWRSPRKVSGKFNSEARETSMSMPVGEDEFYFVSSHDKDSYGGKDIFYSLKKENDKWDKPVNPGPNINTPDDEAAVYISDDAQRLYFSSQGHTSMGGYDIFMCERQPDRTWGAPQNIGYPINTPDNDLFYREAPDGKHAYYSTIRMEGLGGIDIYRITYLGEEKEMVMSTEDILIAGALDTVKRGFFYPPRKIEVDTSITVAGKIYDLKTETGVKAKMEVIDLDISKVIQTTISTDSGLYRVKLPEAKSYGVQIIAKDYLFFLDVMDISGETGDTIVVRNFGLEKVEVGTKVVLENIYFETNKSNLKPESDEQLQQVLRFLEENPSLRMEISGHTDNVGSLKYNTKLSQERAESVVKWLVERGIDPARLEARGYAFTQPIADNSTAEGREKNRRVEFKILSK